MIMIGITGKSGSGKSTYSGYIQKELGAVTLDVDKIGHFVNTLPHVLSSLTQAFGKDILNENGKVERKKLGAIVFSDVDKMQMLTAITWPEMKKEILKIIQESNAEIAVLDYALLPVTDLWKDCKIKVLLEFSKKVRFARLKKRDNLPISYLELREQASLKYDAYSFDLTIKTESPEEKEKLLDLIRKTK